MTQQKYAGLARQGCATKSLLQELWPPRELSEVGRLSEKPTIRTAVNHDAVLVNLHSCIDSRLSGLESYFSQSATMASRHSAARPKRDGENFARTHHNDADETDPKRVKFDVRNPSTLAADAREDDAILDADVIGGSNATKRGAVNLDGYDSDSDNENINVRANSRKKGNVNIIEKLDSYASKGGENGQAAKAEEEDDDDMFRVDEDEDGEKDDGEPSEFDKSGRKKKNVQFLDVQDIAGQDFDSKTGSTIRIDDHESSDDEADVDLAIQEEGVDEEVGAGGLKRNAPKVEAFNLKEEMEDGQFDESGNYVRKAGDVDAVHDGWLEGLSKKDMKKAAEAHQKREAEARKQRFEDDAVQVSELLKQLILRLEKAETPLEALARLGKGQTKTKKIPKWKLKKKGGMDVDEQKDEVEQDPKQVRIKEAIDTITDAADKLLSRDYEDIYDQEREILVREYHKETGEEWMEPTAAQEPAESEDAASEDIEWEFRWTDGRDGGGTQGPFKGPMMKAWQEAGYFGEGVEFRRVGAGGEWTRAVSFA
jgi:CD2 antigen cytoplasmic tail-binding protein 2